MAKVELRTGASIQTIKLRQLLMCQSLVGAYGVRFEDSTQPKIKRRVVREGEAPAEPLLQEQLGRSLTLPRQHNQFLGCV